MTGPNDKNVLAASKKLMQNYLSELLTEEEPTVASIDEPKVKSKEKLDNLLQQVNVAHEIQADKLDAITSFKSESQVKTTPSVKIKETVVDVEQVSTNEEQSLQLRTRKSHEPLKVKADKDYRQGSFQAMFFDVAGLIIAVPLIELGGIHNVEPTTSLMGKPDWFSGVMLHREDKINVVDTARWVMPEKCTDSMCESLNYQYVIMLNNSQWGLMAENLIDTVTLEQDEVKWMENSSKRPWLAGLVKKRMCALLDVDSLIQMLEEGANVTSN